MNHVYPQSIIGSKKNEIYYLHAGIEHFGENIAFSTLLRDCVVRSELK